MAKRIPFFLVSAVGLILALAACGPSAAPASPDEIREGKLLTEDIAQEDVIPRPVAVVAAQPSSETDGSGVPVGFTTEGRPYRGSLDAPVVLEEFSDYQCPFCARFTAQTMPGLVENQIAAGEVLLVYHDFPLETIHAQAFGASHAARCAGEQGAGAYWQMHDLLYERVSSWGVSQPDSVFSALAAELGLDTAAFDACQAGLGHEDKIRADIDYAIAQGVRSTPSFLLNGQPLVGAQPIEAFNQAIAQVLGGEQLAQAAETQEDVLPPRRVAPDPVSIPAADFAAALGDPNAPVTIVEFTDYQCPFCQRYAQETLPTLIENQINSGEVYYILKDLPLESIHPNARSAAAAARCAGEQEQYWAMHDALFAAQADWSSGNLPTTTVFGDLASSLGLDRAAFDTCLEDGRYTTSIQSNIDQALNLGANSTPSFFINGYPVSGAQPYGLFEYAVELAAAGRLAEAYAPPEPNLEGAFALGDEDAPITIVEYTDFQCPFCSRYHDQTLGQILQNYVETGQVRYVFKDFPLSEIHPQAQKAAEAARCAGEQDARFEMYTQLFTAQSEWNGREDAPDLFKGYAEGLGLDTAEFNECLDSGRQAAAVLADFEEGAGQGITGTPGFLMNGRLLSGAQPYATFEQAIQQLLAEESG